MGATHRLLTLLVVVAAAVAALAATTDPLPLQPIKWEQPREGTGQISRITDYFQVGGYVAALRDDGSLVGIDPSDGHTIFTLPVLHPSTCNTTSMGCTLALAWKLSQGTSTQKVVITGFGTVAIVQLETSGVPSATVLQRLPIPQNATAGPAKLVHVIEGLSLLVFTYRNESARAFSSAQPLIAYEMTSGAHLWTFQPDSKPQTCTIEKIALSRTGDSMLAYDTNNHMLYRLRASSGAIEWQTSNTWSALSAAFHLVPLHRQLGATTADFALLTGRYMFTVRYTDGHVSDPVLAFGWNPNTLPSQWLAPSYQLLLNNTIVTQERDWGFAFYDFSNPLQVQLMYSVRVNNSVGFNATRCNSSQSITSWEMDAATGSLLVVSAACNCSWKFSPGGTWLEWTSPFLIGPNLTVTSGVYLAPVTRAGQSWWDPSTAYVAAVDASSGATRWTASLVDCETSAAQPLLTDGLQSEWAMLCDGRLGSFLSSVATRAVSLPSSGSPSWTVAGSSIYTSPSSSSMRGAAAISLNPATGSATVQWISDMVLDCPSGRNPVFSMDPDTSIGRVIYTNRTSAFTSALVAVDSVTGDYAWNFTISGQLAGAVVAGLGGVVSFADTSNYVHGVNGATGSPVWRHRLSLDDNSVTTIWTAVYEVVPAVFFGGSDSILRAFDLDTGARLWNVALQGPPPLGERKPLTYPPSFSEGTMYVCHSALEYLFAVTGAQGKSEWAVKVKCQGTPAAHLGKVYTVGWTQAVNGTRSYGVAKVNPLARDVVWTRFTTTAASAIPSSTILPIMSFSQTDDVLLVSGSTSMVVFAASTLASETLWNASISTSSSDSTAVSLVIKNGYAISVSSSTLYVRNVFTGALLLTVPIPPTFGSVEAAVVIGTTIYLKVGTLVFAYSNIPISTPIPQPNWLTAAPPTPIPPSTPAPSNEASGSESEACVWFCPSSSGTAASDGSNSGSLVPPEVVILGMSSSTLIVMVTIPTLFLVFLLIVRCCCWDVIVNTWRTRNRPAYHNSSSQPQPGTEMTQPLRREPSPAQPLPSMYPSPHGQQHHHYHPGAMAPQPGGPAGVYSPHISPRVGGISPQTAPLRNSPGQVGPFQYPADGTAGGPYYGIPTGRRL